jgi:hypothetical protein
LLIRSNISQKYTARGREQFSFRDWLSCRQDLAIEVQKAAVISV